jgi:hypothetical protein
MKVNFKIKRKIVVNGKEYNSAEDMPTEIREAYEKAVGSGTGVRTEKPQARVMTEIVFNGKEYENLEAMPADVRRVYLSVMKSVETGEASPEMLSALLADNRDLSGQSGVAHFSDDLPKPIEPVSSFSPRWIIVALGLLGLVLMLYYLLAK